MLVLGIETSCDETSAAVVEDGRLVLSNVVSSQIALHAEFGGVVPEIASRQHVRAIVPVVQHALNEAGIDARQVERVAVTQGPGLAGALLVGATFGMTMSQALDVPCVGVNHIEGHVHSVWLTKEHPLPPEPELPLLVLVVSGGHTELVLMRGHGDYEVMGRTLDDAAGEAFDKVARLLGLAYPGGPAIQKSAGAAEETVPMPRAWLPGTFDFSFSGLKTAALHAVQKAASQSVASPRAGADRPGTPPANGLTPTQVAGLAAGFQDSVVDVLVQKTRSAVLATGARSVAIVGGVAANAALRAHAKELLDVRVHLAAPEFCTDNGAMIASAGFYVPSIIRELDVLPSAGLDTASA